MKLFSIVVVAFVAAVAAKSNHTHVHEIVPALKKACNCDPVNCPPALMNAQNVCQCQNAAAIACYKKSDGGCPVPTKKSC